MVYDSPARKISKWVVTHSPYSDQSYSSISDRERWENEEESYIEADSWKRLRIRSYVGKRLIQKGQVENRLGLGNRWLKFEIYSRHLYSQATLSQYSTRCSLGQEPPCWVAYWILILFRHKMNFYPWRALVWKLTSMSAIGIYTGFTVFPPLVLWLSRNWCQSAWEHDLNSKFLVSASAHWLSQYPVVGFFGV